MLGFANDNYQLKQGEYLLEQGERFGALSASIQGVARDTGRQRLFFQAIIVHPSLSQAHAGASYRRAGRCGREDRALAGSAARVAERRQRAFRHQQRRMLRKAE